MKIYEKVRLFIAIIILIWGINVGGCSSRPPPPEPELPEVATLTVQSQREVLDSELPARTYAFLIAEVRPQVSGIIQKRFFVEGSDVKAGDLLYQIDPAPFQAAYENAIANLNSARKSADRARAALEASLANMIRQKAALDLALKNRDRFEELAKEGAVSASERDQAVTEASVSEATVKATEAQIKSDREAVAVAEAVIKQAEAALETARINLGYTRITAPIGGRIGKSNVTVGALVTAHQSLPLTTIQQLDPIFVDATQSSVNLLRLRRNIEAGRVKGRNPHQAKVRLILEDGTPYPLEGTLKFSDVTVDQSTGSFILRMVFPNPKHVLLPGMYVRAVVEEGVVEYAVVVPQQAVSRDFKGNPIVFIVDDQGKVGQRMLTIDRAVGDKWLVSSGLSPGERIIVEGIQKVRPGMAVKVVSISEGPKETSDTQKIKKSERKKN